MDAFAPLPPSVYSGPGQLNAGSYVGGFEHVDLRGAGLGPVATLARRKKWIYVAIAGPEVFVAFALVRLGYAANTFAFVSRRGERALAFDRSWVLPPTSITVADGLRHRDIARVQTRGAYASFRYDAPHDRIVVDLDYAGLEVHVSLEGSAAPPPMTVIAPVEGGHVNVTEKRALLTVRGEARLERTALAVDGALAGYDYTHGLLARHTFWRWAFGLGHTAAGQPIGFNLSHGFLGRRENAAWVGNDLVALDDAEFTYDPARPLEAWSIASTSRALALDFAPSAMHAERQNLVLVRSEFVQPVGTFTGSVGSPKRSWRLGDVAGVVEHQDVIW